MKQINKYMFISLQEERNAASIGSRTLAKISCFFYVF